MSTNHTEHYHLSQWLPDDKVLHTDFNEDNRVIDAALAAQAAELAKKADASTVSSQAAELAKKADASELTKLSAQIKMRNCYVEMYRYTGDGKTTRKLDFNGTPLIVHVMGMNHWLCAIQGSPKGSARYVDGGGGQLVSTKWDGYYLTVTSPNTDPSYMCNYNGERYYVVAVLEVP